MPQLDQTWFASQLFWLAVTFALLYVMMARAAIPRIQGVLESRWKKIRGDLDKAKTLQEKAEAMDAEYKASRELTQVEASAILANAGAEAAAFAVKHHAMLDAELQVKAAEAQEKITSARGQAMEDMEDVAADISLEIVRKLADIKVTRKQAEAVIRQTVKQA